MKLSLYLCSFLLVTSQVGANPITVESDTVRFTMDDSLITAFGGVTPIVQADTLIFSPPAEIYQVKAAPQAKVGFLSQKLEITVEALPGNSIEEISMHTSGLRSEKGRAVLNNAQAFGKLNAKDQFFVNRFFEFESKNASTGSWQENNVTTNSKIAGITGLTTRTLDVSSSHNIRAIAFDSQGRATINAQDGVSFKVQTTAATPQNRVFNWAEKKYNLNWGTETQTLKGGPSYQCDQAGTPCNNLDGLIYRCYKTARQCIGIKDGTAYIFKLDENFIRNVGSIQHFYTQAENEGF